MRCPDCKSEMEPRHHDLYWAAEKWFCKKCDRIFGFTETYFATKGYQK